MFTSLTIQSLSTKVYKAGDIFYMHDNPQWIFCQKPSFRETRPNLAKLGNSACRVSEFRARVVTASYNLCFYSYITVYQTNLRGRLLHVRHSLVILGLKLAIHHMPCFRISEFPNFRVSEFPSFKRLKLGNLAETRLKLGRNSAFGKKFTV